MTRRKVYQPRRKVRVKNPDLFPAWVWCKPPAAFGAVWKRGGPVFDAMAGMGWRVQVVESGKRTRIEIVPPWTYIFLPVPSEDASEWCESLTNSRCSVIMDCHFPIMNMETAIGTDQAVIDAIDGKDTALANLALAEVATVPHPSWAADLAEVNPNVFLLPDLPDDTDGEEFIVRLSEAATASTKVKAERWRTRKEMGL